MTASLLAQGMRSLQRPVELYIIHMEAGREEETRLAHLIRKYCSAGIGENMLLSWYDRERNLESPAHASECHEGCPVRGYWDYALNRGATLAVDFDDGRFVFCFRPLEEFAPLE